jgi:hypothetical protein
LHCKLPGRIGILKSGNKENGKANVVVKALFGEKA